MTKYILKVVALAVCVGFFSCEEDFLNVESDVNAGQNFEISRQEFPITAYSQATGPVQVNGLPTNYLGVFEDDTYGTKTVSNFITEIVPTSFSPDLGTNPKIKSVVLYIPFFSTLTSTDANGDSSYDLLGFMGDEDATYKLSILKSEYLLRDLDPATNFEEAQAYYSDFYTTTLEAQDDSYTVLYEKDDFSISSDEIKVTEIVDGEEEITRIKPGIRQELFYEEDDMGTILVDNRSFWNDIMGIQEDGIGGSFQIDRDYLNNANNFKEFFRGLIFKVENVTNGSHIILNLNDTLTGITLDYTNDAELVADFEEDVFNPSIYQFDITGISINTHTNIPAITIPGGNTNQGDNDLYLRGFEGSYSVINLFGTEDLDGNGVSDNFEAFKENKNKWLINEANITFNVNNTLAGDNQTQRVMLYDLKNNQPVVDYFFDQTSNVDPELSRVNFSVPLTTDSNGNSKYKLRVTEHIKNLLIRDSTNLKLGLFVSNNVNDLAFVKLKTPVTLGSGINEVTVEELPQQSVVSNRSTVLKGTSSSVAETEEVKFEIYYTEED